MAGSSLSSYRGEKNIRAPAYSPASKSRFLEKGVESLDLFLVAFRMIGCPRRDREPPEVLEEIHDTEPHIQVQIEEQKAARLQLLEQSDPGHFGQALVQEKKPEPIIRSRSETRLLETQVEAQLSNVADAIAGRHAALETATAMPLPIAEGQDSKPEPQKKEDSARVCSTSPSVAHATSLILSDAAQLVKGIEPPARRNVTAPSPSVVGQSALILEQVQAAASGTATSEVPKDPSKKGSAGPGLSLKNMVSQGTSERVDALLLQAKENVAAMIKSSSGPKASMPQWDVQVQALVRWYSNAVIGKGFGKESMTVDGSAGCDMAHLARMKENVDLHPTQSLDHSAFMTVKDVAMARSLATGFEERLKGKGEDALPLLSYEFVRMLQIRSQASRPDAFSVAMEFVRETRGEPGSECMKDNLASPAIGETLPLMRILPKMRVLARGVFSKGFLDISHASSDPLSEGEEDQLLECYKKSPISSLAVIRNEMRAVADQKERSEYARASVALELVLDSVIWPPDNVIRDSVPDYIMHGYYDFGLTTDFRDRFKIDKFAFAEVLVDLKARTLDLIATGNDKTRMMGAEEWIAIYLAGQVASRMEYFIMQMQSPWHQDAPVGEKRTEDAGSYYENGGRACRRSTLVYSLLLQELGISNWILKGNIEKDGHLSGRHVLNAMRLERKWYAIDIMQGITVPHHIPVNLDSVDVRSSTIILPFHYGNFKLEMAGNRWSVKAPHAISKKKKQE